MEIISVPMNRKFVGVFNDNSEIILQSLGDNFIGDITSVPAPKLISVIRACEGGIFQENTTLFQSLMSAVSVRLMILHNCRKIHSCTVH